VALFTVLPTPGSSSIFQGIALGFRVGFDGTGLLSVYRNLQSALDHPEVVDNYLYHELSLGRTSSPYSPSVCPEVHINRFGVIPKHHEKDKWRRIIH